MNDKKMPSKPRPSGMGMMNKTPGSMTNYPQGSAMGNAAQEKSKKMDAMRNALSKAAASKKPAPAAPKATLPAKIGETGMKSEMPMKKGDVKKKNLAE